MHCNLKVARRPQQLLFCALITTYCANNGSVQIVCGRTYTVSQKTSPTFLAVTRASIIGFS